jgi:GNAT superfamily N-acetyltransferase
MQVTIRKANPNDWKIVQRLNFEVYEASKQFDEHLNLRYPFYEESEHYYQDIVSNSSFFCVIAEVNNDPVAYLIGKENNYKYRNNRVGEIDSMGTSPNHRSHGIGSKLVQEFKKWCKEKGISHVSACTYYNSPKAINFYKKQGLNPIDINLEGKI